MKTKVTALLFALILCLSTLSTTVFANNFEVEVDVTESTATAIPEDTQTDLQGGDENVEIHNETPVTDVSTEQAEIYPIDIGYDSLGTKRFIYKTYRLAENVPVESVVSLPYQEDGYNWKNTDIILKETIVNSDAKPVTQSVEMVLESDDENLALGGFDTTLEYNQDGYGGTLTLDANSLSIITGEQANYSYNYTVTEVREYPNLVSNDMVSVPKTISVNGKTLSLNGVNWNVTDTTGSSGYSDYKTGYTAVATYTGTATASGVKTTDYVATVNYTGEVIKPAVNENIYTVVYEGTIIPPIPIPSPPYILISLGVILVGVAILLFFKLKSNTKIYILEHGVPKLHHRTRITPNHPVVNIEGLEECRLRVVLSKGLVNKLPERKIYLESDRNNYAVKLGNKLVVQYPPFEKPVLEVSATDPYRHMVKAQKYSSEEYGDFDQEDALEEANPLTEMLPNVWKEEIGNGIPKSAFNTFDLNVDDMESEEQVFRVFWKGEKEDETENK